MHLMQMQTCSHYAQVPLLTTLHWKSDLRNKSVFLLRGGLVNLFWNPQLKMDEHMDLFSELISSDEQGVKE